jgi:hypothetical protein
VEKMFAYMPLLRPLAIAAGGLGCVSINSTVIFTYLKHLELRNVKVTNSVKCMIFLLYVTDFFFPFPNLTSVPDSLDDTELVIYIYIYKPTNALC